MRTDTIIKRDGLEILKEKLGLVEMEKFISLINRENFDYTKWRENLFENMSIDELADKADNFSTALNNKRI